MPNTHLRDDEVDVLGVNALFIDGLAVIFLLFLLLLVCVALATARQLAELLAEQPLLLLGLGELLGLRSLRLRRHVLGLELAKDDVAVRDRRLVHLGARHDEEMLDGEWGGEGERRIPC